MNYPNTQSIQENIDYLSKHFSSVVDSESKYLKIIELGKKLSPLSPEDKTERNRVTGCQSQMYLQSTFDGERIYFQAESDALISSGLAFCLLSVYSGLPPQTVLQEPADYLNDLGIATSISPNRANGLASLHLKMKQEAIAALTGVQL